MSDTDPQPRRTEPSLAAGFPKLPPQRTGRSFKSGLDAYLREKGMFQPRKAHARPSRKK
jgi:hypothetical protein